MASQVSQQLLRSISSWLVLLCTTSCVIAIYVMRSLMPVMLTCRWRLLTTKWHLTRWESRFGEGKFVSVPLKDHKFRYIYHHYLTDMLSSHESMTCESDGIYLTLRSLNGTDLILSLGSGDIINIIRTMITDFKRRIVMSRDGIIVWTIYVFVYLCVDRITSMEINLYFFSFQISHLNKT